jgi:cold shock CspA family protein
MAPILVILGLLAVVAAVAVVAWLVRAPATEPPRITWRPAYGQRGTVDWYSEMKGYGFIRPDPGMAFATPVGVFVHRTGLKPPLERLEAGQRVRYDVPEGWGRWGPVAANVEVVR